jgi:hypothetical protein
VRDIIDLQPDVDVDEREYLRLLGYPPGTELQERALELATWAREWYSARGRPWVRAARIDEVATVDGGLTIGGRRFSPSRLCRLVADAGATSAVVAAVSAGVEAEAYAQALWEDGKPDEYFFLEVYASAVVEHLVMMTGARLCAAADAERLAVLPHDSPGYPGWDIGEQSSLLALIQTSGAATRPLALDVLDSGMLRPKKSLLAVFGLSPHLERVERLTTLVPCDSCALRNCAFRRRPYRRATTASGIDTGTSIPGRREPSHPRYSVNRKALARWAAERLELVAHSDGTIDATFRYDGTTCSNMGQALAFQYEITLGPREDGYPVRHHRSIPVAGDTGHRFMCRYLTHGDGLLQSIAAERPFDGRRLDDVLVWERPQAPAGCYCDIDSRQHKWGLVLETIHYALSQPPMGPAPAVTGKAHA